MMNNPWAKQVEENRVKIVYRWSLIIWSLGTNNTQILRKGQGTVCKA